MVKPDTLQEALRMRSGKVPLAGGTDLMVREVNKEFLYIGHLPELKGIRALEGKIIIGSATTLDEIVCSKIVPEVLKQGVKVMASPGIRNMATIGGNICNSSPAGDTLPPLYILDASLLLVSLNEVRTVSVMDFIKGPGKNILREDELLKEIIIPDMDFTYAGYRKIGTRNALALSKASIAYGYKIEMDRLVDIRIALGAVAPTPVRSKSIEEFLIETYPWENGEMDRALVMYDKVINPITDQRSTAEYRRWVSLNLIKDFLMEVSSGED